MIKPTEELLGVRISKKVKKVLDRYCKQNGISRKYFVEEAIREKLIEEEEDRMDLAITKERSRNPQFVDQKTIDNFFKKKLKRK